MTEGICYRFRRLQECKRNESCPFRHVDAEGNEVPKAKDKQVPSKNMQTVASEELLSTAASPNQTHVQAERNGQSFGTGKALLPQPGGKKKKNRQKAKALAKIVAVQAPSALAKAKSEMMVEPSVVEETQVSHAGKSVSIQTASQPEIQEVPLAAVVDEEPDAGRVSAMPAPTCAQGKVLKLKIKKTT